MVTKADEKKTPYPGEGRPDCPVCGGLGYTRLDVSTADPKFGRVVPCECLELKNRERQSSRLYRVSHMDGLQQFTFANFRSDGRGELENGQQASLELALARAKDFATSMEGWLVLQGGYGCGKTHLSAAIANVAVSNGVPTLYLTVPDLLDWLRSSFDDNSSGFEERFGQIREVRLLVLDDFGTQSGSPWAQEKLYQIVNHRYMLRLPTVFTTNLSLSEIEARIRSRLTDKQLATHVMIDAPDYRQGKGASLQPGLSTLVLHRHQTIANFLPRDEEGLAVEEVESLRSALSAAAGFAEDPNGWFVLLGDPGAGKTHLAAAIANFASSHGKQPLFVFVPDLLDHLRATFSPASESRYDTLFETIRTVPLLVLDDLGTQNMTPWVREKLYQLFNYRYDAKLPTIITTDNAMDEIDKRIRVRLLDSRLCRMFVLKVPPFIGGKHPPRAPGGTEKKRTSRPR